MKYNLFDEVEITPLYQSGLPFYGTIIGYVVSRDPSNGSEYVDYQIKDKLGNVHTGNYPERCVTKLIKQFKKPEPLGVFQGTSSSQPTRQVANYDGLNGMFESPQDSANYKIKAITNCQHSWKLYQGFSENYDYCTKCDEKRK